VPDDVRARTDAASKALGASKARCHLVIVLQPDWQAPEDFRDIAQRIRTIDPGIGVFLVSAEDSADDIAELAATRPTLVYAPGPLGAFRPRRGRVYHGRPMPKVEQVQRLHAAGVPVPRTLVMHSGMGRLDPAIWGRHVIVKPTDIKTSSKGRGIQLMRTERVRYRAPQEFPDDHPGRLGPMIVQQFIDTGPHVNAFRVLTLFGTPLLCQLNRTATPRVSLDSDDRTLESAVIATQGAVGDRTREMIYDADVVALAKAAHRAVPEVPLKGCDVVREAATGRLFVLELNTNSNTWHFSSSFQAAERALFPPEFNRARLEQLDAFGTAAHVLADVTRREAE